MTSTRHHHPTVLSQTCIAETAVINRAGIRGVFILLSISGRGVTTRGVAGLRRIMVSTVQSRRSAVVGNQSGLSAETSAGAGTTTFNCATGDGSFRALRWFAGLAAAGLLSLA